MKQYLNMHFFKWIPPLPIISGSAISICLFLVAFLPKNEPKQWHKDSNRIPDCSGDVRGITPDIAGIDAKLTFPKINLGSFPNNDLQILNRWGQILYTAKPYKEDWDGRDKDGKELPAGNYFFLLQLGKGDFCRGSVYIYRG